MALSNVYDPNRNVDNANVILETAFENGLHIFHSAFHYGNGYTYQLLDSFKYKKEAEFIIKIMGDPRRIYNGLDGISNYFNIVKDKPIDYVQLIPTKDDYPDGYSINDIIKDLDSKGPLYTILLQLQKEHLINKIGVEIRDEAELFYVSENSILSFVVCDMSIMRRVIFSTGAIAHLKQCNLKLFAIRPLACGWLTKRYRKSKDFLENDNRKEWYYPGEGYREAVDKILDGQDVEEISVRYLNSKKYIDGIVIGISNIEDLFKDIKYDSLPVLDSCLEDILDNLFEQPQVLEPD